jgi:hypothetical protein
MVIVADINTIWRSRPFEALAELRPVLGLQPNDPVASYRARRKFFGSSTSSVGAMSTFAVTLPFMWASARARRAHPKLWRFVREHFNKSNHKPTVLIVTSPHYTLLAEQVAKECPILYFCSDDYFSYAGWNADDMRELEARVMQVARHSFFVSTELQTRAVNRHRVALESTSVCMNATEHAFTIPVGRDHVDSLFAAHPRLKRQLVGVVGGINERLDFGLLRAVAELESVGSLLFVGPVSPSLADADWRALQANPRCVFVGAQPHATLPVWLQALDVALIPYAKTTLNRFCSPMRLFDHLAAGRPIVATSACPQVGEFKEHVAVAPDREAFVNLVGSLAVGTSARPTMIACSWKNTWAERAKLINEQINEVCSKAT